MCWRSVYNTRRLSPPPYNRRLRKFIHILAGFPALVLKFLPWWGMIVLALLMLAGTWSLPPRWSSVAVFSKPEDRARGHLRGVRNYFLSVLLLVLVFGSTHTFYATAGWLALAWGDGAAGLVGGSRSAKLPWSQKKPVVGLLAGMVCTFIAIIVACFWSSAATQASLGVARLVGFAVVAVAIGLLESLDLALDDNFIVGLGTPALLLGLTPLGI